MRCNTITARVVPMNSPDEKVPPNIAISVIAPSVQALFHHQLVVVVGDLAHHVGRPSSGRNCCENDPVAVVAHRWLAVKMEDGDKPGVPDFARVKNL